VTEVVYGKKFLKSVNKNLPQDQRDKLDTQIKRLENDPTDPRLKVKSLSGRLSYLHSFRITRSYRVLFRYRQDDAIQLLRADHRKDIYE
jgi:addiction module RelE/StbE family toxin